MFLNLLSRQNNSPSLPPSINLPLSNKNNLLRHALLPFGRRVEYGTEGFEQPQTSQHLLVFLNVSQALLLIFRHNTKVEIHDDDLLNFDW